jgi:hypothetical protein
MKPPRPIQRITEIRSYPNTDTSALGERALEALSDETAGAILRESAWLPEKEKEIVLGIVR